jgi:hypothetical protein
MAFDNEPQQRTGRRTGSDCWTRGVLYTLFYFNILFHVSSLQVELMLLSCAASEQQGRYTFCLQVVVPGCGLLFYKAAELG